MPDGTNGSTLTAGSHIDLLQFRLDLWRGGWTNRCVESGSSTRVGVNDRGKIQPVAIVGVSDWLLECQEVVGRLFD
jgi:hypothetical protein